MARIVIALGGNALGKNPVEQIAIVKNTAKAICEIMQEGHEIIISHGNGPQVGMINNAFESATKVDNKIPLMPFAECGAMSQGYIGYHLQNAIYNQLLSLQIQKNVVTTITQVLVDEKDQAFSNPTKPIGSFYSEQEAKKLAEKNNFIVKEDAGRGWRRVIASPKPLDIIEKDIIISLLNSNNLVIACGGGGIPVIKKNNCLYGVPAVIDKDFASEKLAEVVQADILMILTAVPQVAINFGKPDQQNLTKLTFEMANKYIAEKQFAEGSMLPKVQAALMFVEKIKHGKAIIAKLDDALLALKKEKGTTIVK